MTPQRRRCWPAAFVGILEEYRFYVREAHAAPGDESSMPRPQLSVARFVPGTDRLWGGTGATVAVDIADRVTDLQVSLFEEPDGQLGVAVTLEGP